MASLPTAVRALSTWPPAGQVGTYLAVAAVALIVAVELHAFTTVRMSYGFAVVFVVVTTLAAAGGWAVARWGLHVLVGTAFEQTEEELMWEFVNSAVAGLLAGGIFRVYLRRTVLGGRVPDSVLANRRARTAVDAPAETERLEGSR